MTPDFQGRTPEHQARNDTCVEWIFIGGGLLGMFAVGFFAGQFLVAAVAGWM